MYKNLSKLLMEHDTGHGNDPEKYARESFTWRGMDNWEVWTLTAFVCALLVAVAVTQVF